MIGFSYPGSTYPAGLAPAKEVGSTVFGVGDSGGEELVYVAHPYPKPQLKTKPEIKKPESIRQRLVAEGHVVFGVGASYAFGTTQIPLIHTARGSSEFSFTTTGAARQRLAGNANVVFGLRKTNALGWQRLSGVGTSRMISIEQTRGLAENGGLALYRQRLMEDLIILHGVDPEELDRLLKAVA